MTSLLTPLEKNCKMTKKPLQELFDAMYHGKLVFDEFLTSPLAQNYEVISEGGNGKRRILKPKDKFKEFHRFLNLFLIEFLPVNERVVFSYRKGVGPLNAVEKHQRGRHFFQTDIVSFFGSIDQSLTRRIICEGAKYSPISDIEKYIDRIIEMICIDDSLPIGFPASAPLSNCVLFDFDNALEKYCDEHELVYSRYSDDIIVSAQSPDEIFNIVDVIARNLRELVSPRLDINRAKTRFFKVGGRISLLGMMILPNGKISPDTRRKTDLEVMLHYYSTDRARFRSLMEKKKPNLSEDDYEDFLSGHLNYVDSIDKDYTDKLRKKFGTTTIDSLIHKGFAKRK
ncbi:reverse transcriptase domain-containing protein [Massilia suwonensis]|uniref:Reverse transcriptase domain-containing protein n=1 Tax=Massilia suwonensis TaxID=648895 RepID=A0ABW0MPB4_9BURK